MKSEANSRPDEPAAMRGPVGDSFARDLRALEGDGFAKWLLKSFGGANPEPVPGRFHWNGDALFSEMFGQVFWQFKSEEIDIARTGLSKAFERVVDDDAKITFYGLFEIFGVAEVLNAEEHVKRIAQILHNWMNPSSQQFSKEPANLDDIIALRDLLECVFRMLWESKEVFSVPSHKYNLISNWCFKILTERSNALGRSLFPTFAPMYICALANQKQMVELHRLKRVLLTGALTLDDANRDLYIFQSKTHAGGSFPYDVDTLFEIGQEFLARNGYIAEQPDNVIQLYSTNNPLSATPASATNGHVPISRQISSEYLEALRC